MYTKEKAYAASMQTMNSLCCASTSTISRISLIFPGFYRRKTTICFNGFKGSFPRDYANAPTTEEFISVMSPGAYADCRIGLKL